jgi:hypothetical protein
MTYCRLVFYPGNSYHIYTAPLLDGMPMSAVKSPPRNYFLVVSTLILAVLLVIILALAVVVIKKNRQAGRLAGLVASPTTPALAGELQATPSPFPVTPGASAPGMLQATETQLALSVPSETASAQPSATSSPLPLETSTSADVSVAQVSPGSNAYCRKGPGVNYDAVTYLEMGSTYQVVGQDGSGAWWQVQFTPEVRCWEGDPASVLEGPVELVPRVAAPPLPDWPTFLSKKSHCDPTLNTMTVWLTWGAARGASGYRLYRNDEKIAEVGPAANSFTELAPRFVDLKYRLEPFNEYGVSPGFSVTINACK